MYNISHIKSITHLIHPASHTGCTTYTWHITHSASLPCVSPWILSPHDLSLGTGITTCIQLFIWVTPRFNWLQRKEKVVCVCIFVRICVCACGARPCVRACVRACIRSRHQKVLQVKCSELIGTCLCLKENPVLKNHQVSNELPPQQIQK